MSKSSALIRFTDASVQPSSVGPDEDLVVRRIVGTVEARYLIPLFDDEALRANPRSAKRNSVVEEILGTLHRRPELFRFMSKGLLLGASSYKALERSRYQLEFVDKEIEGILDGGHNMLALGLHFLRPHMDEREWRRIKLWDDLMDAWELHRGAIEAAAKDDYRFPVSIELLVPADQSEETLEQFEVALLEISAARNNNAQLPQEAKANKRGFYDDLRSFLEADFASKVEWKPNEWDDDVEKRPIKVRDLIALAWIPLNLLNEQGCLPADISVSPQNVYRNKGECSFRFDQLMESEAVTSRDGGTQHRLIHLGVRSALQIAADLPELYDDVYELFPEAYNRGNRRFGANPIVKLYEPERRKQAKTAGKDISGYTTVQPRTPFLRRPVKHSYPEGLIFPLVYGLQGLMEVENSRVQWRVSKPRTFVREALREIANNYKLVLDLARWDPQKISKNPASHEWAVQGFRTAAEREEMARRRKTLSQA